MKVLWVNSETGKKQTNIPAKVYNYGDNVYWSYVRQCIAVIVLRFVIFVYADRNKYVHSVQKLSLSLSNQFVKQSSNGIRERQKSKEILTGT